VRGEHVDDVRGDWRKLPQHALAISVWGLASDICASCSDVIDAAGNDLRKVCKDKGLEDCGGR
jgi:hypothetical protein